MGKIQYSGLQCKIDIACLPIKHELDIINPVVPLQECGIIVEKAAEWLL